MIMAPNKAFLFGSIFLSYLPTLTLDLAMWSPLATGILVNVNSTWTLGPVFSYNGNISTPMRLSSDPLILAWAWEVASSARASQRGGVQRKVEAKLGQDQACRDTQKAGLGLIVGRAQPSSHHLSLSQLCLFFVILEFKYNLINFNG